MSEGLPPGFRPYHKRVERALRAGLPVGGRGDDAVARAMAYSLFAGGKRVRPILCLLTFDAAGGSGDGIDQVAAAVEMIHTYSLIHDDLPCMDDDDLRRGQPACHVVHGEAIALLAGDALLTRAITLLAGAESIDPSSTLRMLEELGRAIGYEGMIGGQALDLAAEKNRSMRVSDLETIHRKKTGAFLAASATLGAVAACAPEEAVRGVRLYGEHLGLAFQIADDLLDVTSRVEEAGKRVRKDAARGKATYPALVGVEESRQTARDLAKRGVEALPFDTRGGLLARLAEFVVDRVD